jgi:hypothetical protein
LGKGKKLAANWPPVLIITKEQNQSTDYADFTDFSMQSATW